MAWRRPGDKPLSEPMMDSLLTHICVTRPQWVNSPRCWRMNRFQRRRISNTTNNAVQSSAVITLSNVVRWIITGTEAEYQSGCWMHKINQSGCWMHKRHPIACPLVSFVNIWEIWPRDNSTALYKGMKRKCTCIFNVSSNQSSSLTHWGQDKIDAILQTTFSNAISWMKMFEFRLQISLKFVPKGPINNIPALVQVMAWHRTGDKPLSELMMAQFNDVSMRHSASMS